MDVAESRYKLRVYTPMAGSKRDEGSTVIISAVSPGSRFRNCYRALLITFLIGALAIITVSHYEPIDSGLEPLFFLGLVPLVAVQFARLYLMGHRGRLRNITSKLILRHALNFVVISFIVLAGASFIDAQAGDASAMCTTGIPSSCYKVDSWKISDGVYYRQYPYDAQDNLDFNQPWVAISKSEYVLEVGTKLREAVVFGVALLCFAMLLSVMESVASSNPSEKLERRGELYQLG